MSDLNKDPLNSDQISGGDSIEQAPQQGDLDTTPDQIVREPANLAPPPATQSDRTGREDAPPQAVHTPRPSRSPAAQIAPDEASRHPVLAPPALSDTEAEWQMRRISRRSFLTGGLGIEGRIPGCGWLILQYQDNGIPWPFRGAVEDNDGFARG